MLISSTIAETKTVHLQCEGNIVLVCPVRLEWRSGSVCY